MAGDADQAHDLLETDRLNRLIDKYAPHDGDFDLPLEGLKVIRRSKVDSSSVSVVSSAGVCIVTQGAKRVLLGDASYEYGGSRMVIYSMALPVEAKIVKASPSEPYLCLVLNISPQKIAELALKVFPHGLPKPQDISGIHVGHIDDNIIEAAVRLMELMKTPKEASLLSELIIDEIFIRLLTSPFGPALAQIGAIESNTAKIVKSISWLRDNYDQGLEIEALAKLVNMSESSFHRHFKSVTMMTPVQFQKILRLQKAKSLLLTEMLDVTTTSHRVGYASSSQFSREYSRYYGVSPAKDATQSRQG